ncbi:paxillin homolog 1 isoform X6 [Maniola jurtina]|uniref:paxillin homolog 1 isoform X6 n=1 Tax=Maniola jurtina TaxID=191418 RepID=UPI001E68D0FA|nr:paxillin homolog 1 isoform X6 [Maniola jurtina]
MGLLMSVAISYIGFHEALECMRHIISGIVPETEPNFNDLVEYYTRLLQKSANSPRDWTRDCGLGYLSLTEDKEGRINAAEVKYYDRQHNTTALLFSTKISSFGQDSVEENTQSNGDIAIERYSLTKTKTIISDTAESFSVGQKNRSSSPTHRRSPNAYERDNRTGYEENDASRKLTWEYSPKQSPRNPSSPLPEIQFESYSGDKNGELVLSDNFLRSLDGIKYRPLQRNDPSGRRKSFRKRTSSSSNSSRESRASREEELKIFTSLEEAEFKNMSRDENYSGFGSAPNLAARSYSRSRSREKSRSPLPVDERIDEASSIHREVPLLSSFEERDETKEIPELIFSGEYTKAMNKDWHSGHFCCWQCDESLTGQRYVLRDEHPYCIKCYESAFANGCEECNKIIGIDSKDLSYKDKHWHEACFLCAKCRVSLVDKQFGSKLDKIYCGNCYDAQFASRCDGCGEVFRAGTKKMEYKTRQWHEKCFCCVVCKNPIGTKSFIPREQEIYCAGCYEDKFATRCVKCNKIITQGGVTYKNEPWHRECFTCTHCNTSLAGQRFTSRDEKPYCAECFGELFAKRCTSCSKPITGIGGTRFISFEDRHWHNDCFICAHCKHSLVGKGFIVVAQDIVCPDCAKEQLM